MGYIKHDAIVVTSWDDKHFAAVHAKAKELLGAVPDSLGTGEYNYVSEIVDSRMNGQQSFLIAPDGSKEGWDTSTVAEERRAEFLTWLERDARCYATALVARFGGDDEDLSVRVVEARRDLDPESR